jgi:Major Facilitator Superfamily
MTVPPEDLASAVSVRSLLQTGAATVGYTLGGVLVAVAGSGWAISVDALTFALAAYCYSRLRVEQTVPAGPRTSMLADLGDGAREVLAHPWLWLLIGQALIYHLFYGGAQTVLGPIVIGDQFGRSSWGLAMGTLMAGFVVGGLACLRWRPRRSLMVGTVLLSLTALFPLAMALSDHLWVVLVGAFLHGFRPPGLRCLLGALDPAERRAGQARSGLLVRHGRILRGATARDGAHRAGGGAGGLPRVAARRRLRHGGLVAARADLARRTAPHP